MAKTINTESFIAGKEKGVVVSCVGVFCTPIRFQILVLDLKFGI